MKRNKNLGKTLNRFYAEKSDVQELLYGELGIPINGVKKVDVPGRAGYVYVRLRGNKSELIEAYNASVPSKYDYPVIVSRKSNTYTIAGKDQGKYSNMGNSGNATTTVGVTPMPNHGGQHSFNLVLGMGADPTWVYGQQFMPNVAYPSGSSMMLTINPTFYEWNGQWKYSQSTGTPSFSPYVPTITGSARMALLFVDGQTGALQIAGGVGFSGSINNAYELAQYIPDVDRNKSIPIAAVKLTTGTTALDYSMIYDMRDYFTVSKYFNGIGIQDGGVSQGTGTILNFGNNLSVSMAGGVATIDGQAGGGGSNILVQDEGVLLGTGTVFNFTGAGVTATLSGTVANINIPGGGGSTGTATYFRVAQPTPLLSTTGTYWKLNEPYATGSLAVFNQGHALIIGIDYSAQYPQSGTYQYTEAQPTGTYHLAMYGALV